MSVEQIYWKRRGWVAIENRAKQMVKFGGDNGALDFKFEGEKVGDICPKFKVGILGLSTEHINQLTVWSPQEAANLARRIQVFAGYEKDSLANPIFDGYVLNAMPTNPPEMWMNFDCIYSMRSIVPIEKQYTMSGKLKDIAKKIANELDLGFEWRSKDVDGEKSGKFVFTGSKIALAGKFAQAYNVLVYNNNGTLVVTDVRGWYNDVTDAKPVSTETGMLGLGNVTLKGATIRMRLNDKYGLQSWVNLKSTLVPSANGDYFVTKKKHVGHFRGDDWYTELETVRKHK